MSSTLLKNQHLNLCLSDYVADIKLHTIIIKCRLDTTYNNSAVEAEVDGGKLHPKLWHLKHSNVTFSGCFFLSVHAHMGSSNSYLSHDLVKLKLRSKDILLRSCSDPTETHICKHNKNVFLLLYHLVKEFIKNIINHQSPP